MMPAQLIPFVFQHDGGLIRSSVNAVAFSESTQRTYTGNVRVMGPTVDAVFFTAPSPEGRTWTCVAPVAEDWQPTEATEAL